MPAGPEHGTARPVYRADHVIHPTHPAPTVHLGLYIQVNGSPSAAAQRKTRSYPSAGAQGGEAVYPGFHSCDSGRI